MDSYSGSGAAVCAKLSWPERMVRRLAGTLVLVSLLLAWKVSPWWFVLTGFVGVNLVQSSFTNFCPAEIIFRRLEARRDAKAATTAR